MAGKKAKTEDKGGEEGKGSNGGKVKLILGSLVLLGAGAGGAYGAVAAGLLGPSHQEEHGPDVPEPVLKGEEDPFAPPGEKEGEEAAEPVYGEGGSKYRTAYYRFEEGFTSNLKDSAALVQISIAASTKRDGRVLQWLERHKLAIRSAILVELSSTPEEEVYTIEGKERLRKRLAAAINRVLTEQEGFGGVDAVHFQSFLVQ